MKYVTVQLRHRVWSEGGKGEIKYSNEGYRKGGMKYEAHINRLAVDEVRHGATATQGLIWGGEREKLSTKVDLTEEKETLKGRMKGMEGKGTHWSAGCRWSTSRCNCDTGADLRKRKGGMKWGDRDWSEKEIWSTLIYVLCVPQSCIHKLYAAILCVIYAVLCRSPCNCGIGVDLRRGRGEMKYVRLRHKGWSDNGTERKKLGPVTIKDLRTPRASKRCVLDA